MIKPYRKLKVMVVDDEHFFREINSRKIKEYLRDKVEYDIITVEGPEESIKLASSNKLDFVFTDLQMAGDQNSGYHLTRKIKAQTPNTHVLITSNSLLSQIEKNALDAGASGCIQLPMRQIDLEKAFNGYL